MQRLKTRRGASKRFKKTSKGEVKYKRAGARHILTKKGRKRKRRLRKPGYLSSPAKAQVKKTLPYS